ncbi:MAG: 4-hydroxy-3-methylbut-2-enyl diphosphate reductase [Rhodospirillaceae bacterium]
MKVLLAQPRGFCAGVVRAVDIVELALKKYGPPVYVRHEIVHNKRVVEDLRAKGAVFVDGIADIPPGAVTVFSAHGVSRAVVRDAEGRKLDVLDATCPLVSKVHAQGYRYSKSGYEVVLIGHAGHIEVEGTLGQIDGKVHLIGTVEEAAALTVAPGTKLAYVTQTTLSVDDTRDIITMLRARFPDIEGPDVKDICYATQNRQQAVRELARHSDVVLVLGAKNSSNSNRLKEIGDGMDVPSYLIDDATMLDPAWVAGKNVVGITAGASAPEALVEELIAKLRTLGATEVETLGGVSESIVFKLPHQLRDMAKAS